MGATQTTPNPNGNPFDVPLNSEIEESKQRQAAAQKSNPDDYNPFDEPLASEIAEQKHAAAAASGQVTNDVGEQVIVPQPGESFADTVKRGVALGKQRQQAGTQQAAIDKETATIPSKTAQTLGGAAVAGAAGPAALAIPGEVAELAVRHLLGTVPGLVDAGGESVAREKLAEIAPKALQIVKEWALPTSAVGGLLKILSMSGKQH